MVDFTQKLKEKKTEFPGPDAGVERSISDAGPDTPMASADADQAVLSVAKIDQGTDPLVPRKTYIGEIVLLNLAIGARPAVVLNINQDQTLDLCVFFNGPKDYPLTGHTETGTWYTAILQGEEEGQWKFQP